jgi:hypothetical protein
MKTKLTYGQPALTNLHKHLLSSRLLRLPLFHLLAVLQSCPHYVPVSSVGEIVQAIFRQLFSMNNQSHQPAHCCCRVEVLAADERRGWRTRMMLLQLASALQRRRQQAHMCRNNQQDSAWEEKQSSIKIELKYICHNSLNSVAEPHHFYAAPDPAPGKNFDAAPDPAATAPAPTLLYSKDKFLKRTKV